ncbi:DNA repair protein RadC [Tumebacillus sp. ITR2]|uniref:DNA repair protein RadC n=1 Tax=Tumebacillus amylolyticus TaxID=2801339 RepID=A0ABS1JBQ7_9BACL|nr:DNA repair protein RadC [Tumebacillus amylolyticus]MBL0387058.1 DNA repair protein RadC [Tumebacillus amylolyticus]
MNEALLEASSSVLVREIPVEDRPRERLRQVGPEQMSNAELLAILLRTGSRGRSAVNLAEQVLKRFGSIRELLDADLQELTEIPGVGLAKAAQLKAAIEVGRRIARNSNTTRPQFLTARDAAEYMMDRLQFQLKEHFVALHLDAKRRLIGEEIVSVGSLDSTVAHPREIFKTAIKRSASAIICLHNHPSGDPTPSYEDLEVTRRLIECGRILGVDVLDHIVIGSHSFCSMREKGWLD